MKPVRRKATPGLADKATLAARESGVITRALRGVGLQLSPPFVTTEDELERMAEQLTAILDAVGKVSELDLAEVPPTSHPLSVVNAFRSDEPRPSLSRDDVFANAPAREDDLFRVPPSA